MSNLERSSISEEQEALVVHLLKEECPTVEPLEASSLTSIKEQGAHNHNNDDGISYSEALQ